MKIFEMIRKMNHEGCCHSGLLIIVLVLSMSFMLNHSGQFMSVDEPKWLYIRDPQLIKSISTLNWSDTYINDKPGVLPAALSGIVLLFLDPFKYSPETYDQFLFFWRLPIVIFNTIMLIIIFFSLKKLFDRNFAILCTSFIAFNPIIIGISQIVNPDATLWSTGFISILAFFLYLKTNLRKYIFQSGFFLGLALISKYFATILYVLFFLAVVIEYLLDNTLKIGHLSKRLYDLFILIGITMLVYTVLFPATWVNPALIFKGTILSGMLAPGYFVMMPGLFILFVDIWIMKGRLLNFIRQNNILDNIVRLLSLFVLIFIGFLLYNLFWNYPFFNLNEFIISVSFIEFSKFDSLTTSVYYTIMTISPLLFLALLIFFINLSIKGSTFLKLNQFSKINTILYSIIIFIFIYILGASFSGYITSTRYQIMLYPVYCIIAATVIILISGKNNLKLMTLLVILLNIFVVFQTSPFYLQYNNALNIHDAEISDAGGFGSYELAQEVNKYPDAKSMSIWVDREGFIEFFIGKGYWRSATDPIENEEIDYLVLTSGGKNSLNRQLKQNIRPWNHSNSTGYILLEYYNKTPIYQININNNPNNYVKFVKIDREKNNT